MIFTIVFLAIWSGVLTAGLMKVISYCISLHELVNSVRYFLNKIEMDSCDSEKSEVEE